MTLEEWQNAHLTQVNARIAAEGRCVMHKPDVTIPATHLLELPIGNVLPLCTACLEWWVQDAKETGDRHSQPVSIQPIGA